MTRELERRGWPSGDETTDQAPLTPAVDLAAVATDIRRIREIADRFEHALMSGKIGAP